MTAFSRLCVVNGPAGPLLTLFTKSSDAHVYNNFLPGLSFLLTNCVVTPLRKCIDDCTPTFSETYKAHREDADMEGGEGSLLSELSLTSEEEKGCLFGLCPRGFFSCCGCCWPAMSKQPSLLGLCELREGREEKKKAGETGFRPRPCSRLVLKKKKKYSDF